MPKAKGKGGKSQRRGRKANDQQKRELQYKEEGQDYARVTSLPGNKRVVTEDSTGEKRLAVIRGRMANRVWIRVGDVVLLGLRDWQPDWADIILKYNQEEVNLLKRQNQLPETFLTPDQDQLAQDALQGNVNIEFDEGSDEEDDDDDDGDDTYDVEARKELNIDDI